MRKILHYSLLLVWVLPLAAIAQEKVDLSMMQRIRKEGLQHSRVMDIAFNLTDMSGNRLTNSTGFFRAANYAKETLAGWGLQNTAIDPWGEFGKGWELEKAYVALTVPYYKPLQAYLKAWCGGTDGLQHATVMVISMKDTLALDAYKGQLKGKLLILDQPDNYRQSFKADASRLGDDDLAKLAAALPQTAPIPDTAMRRARQQFFMAQRTSILLKALAKNEGAIAVISSGGARSHDGTIFAQGGGAYKASDRENFPDIVLGTEDYNTILRVAKLQEVKMDIELKAKFLTNDLQGYNVIAEIPGTDPNLKDEVVMIGAHLDSWQTASGATDNAAGSAVMMEAMRILKQLGIQPKRTIRIGLWSGEEEGLLGSKGYVRKTFGDPATMQLLPAHDKFSTYFNIDNGTGKIRGIYLQGNEACRNIFAKWLEPFKDLGAATISSMNTGGTDHLSFDAVGLPGFQFIQDPIEYSTRTHHSNMDVYDHLSEDDLKQVATIIAAFTYNAAQRGERIPRKDLPAAAVHQFSPIGK
ncbi:MAG: M28 family metallopeptidase [Sediminibacterium sp.]